MAEKSNISGMNLEKATTTVPLTLSMEIGKCISKIFSECSMVHEIISVHDIIYYCVKTAFFTIKLR